MSKITEFADRQKARDVAIAATLDQIAAGVNDLEAKITVLVNTTKELTPEEQAALDDVESASDALVTKTGAIVADIADTSDQV